MHESFTQYKTNVSYVWNDFENRIQKAFNTPQAINNSERLISHASAYNVGTRRCRLIPLVIPQ